ncbi:zinc-binding protein [Hartmannibacter diazotrophicus]|uniref:DNA gyrase inhibitor YacG n=1 Tax=Hartmannibacter diazotrophicus TaxID=1482074 RepID=A0A2C9D288_9HYPH|nr:DNA gyrase inhibitor YacG [Hartmannibacter diazotrophicus]SON54333.1 zinc-binding protein [Hartmannibacter diazotrophicus]
MADQQSRAKAVARCPICNEPTDPGFSPFCSKRCHQVDLHRWLAGSYRLPVVEEDDIDPADIEEPKDEKQDGTGRS